MEEMCTAKHGERSLNFHALQVQCILESLKCSPTLRFSDLSHPNIFITLKIYIMARFFYVRLGAEAATICGNLTWNHCHRALHIP